MTPLSNQLSLRNLNALLNVRFGKKEVKKLVHILFVALNVNVKNFVNKDLFLFTTLFASLEVIIALNSLFWHNWWYLIWVREIRTYATNDDFIPNVHRIVVIPISLSSVLMSIWKGIKKQSVWVIFDLFFSQKEVSRGQ
jgi:hypothetical protein